MNNKFVYKNLKTNEEVEDFMAENYVLNKLGITIVPKGENGTMTEEQLDNIHETVEWYFSGNWIKEKVKKDEVGNIFELIAEECYYDDKWREEKCLKNMKI